MRYPVIYGLVLLVLALNSVGREPIYLGEENGRAILESIANNTSNQSSNNIIAVPTGNVTKKEGGLWSWGTAPAGYMMNESGTLTRLPNAEEWHPSI